MSLVWGDGVDGGTLAFTLFRFDDELELGIETLRQMQCKGLAVAVASRMIEDLLGRGIIPSVG